VENAVKAVEDPDAPEVLVVRDRKEGTSASAATLQVDRCLVPYENRFQKKHLYTARMRSAGC
jgi:hypothetical protein